MIFEDLTEGRIDFCSNYDFDECSLSYYWSPSDLSFWDVDHLQFCLSSVYWFCWILIVLQEKKNLSYYFHCTSFVSYSLRSSSDCLYHVSIAFHRSVLLLRFDGRPSGVFRHRLDGTQSSCHRICLACDALDHLCYYYSCNFVGHHLVDSWIQHPLRTYSAHSHSASTSSYLFD